MAGYPKIPNLLQDTHFSWLLDQCSSFQVIFSQAKSNLRELEGGWDGRKEESKNQGHQPWTAASGGPREQSWLGAEQESGPQGRLEGLEGSLWKARHALPFLRVRSQQVWRL